jgi:two-component system OmpR family response regulator
MSRILIVEDEQHIADGLRFNLVAEQHDVEVIETGEAALAQLSAHPSRFELVILDVMLPGIDGFRVVADLRRAGQFVPVLMLTARGRPEDVLRGFESGADDYLAKPFEFPELFARLRAMTRRPAFERPAVLRVADLELDPAGRRVARGGVEIELTAKEFALLEYLMRHRHVVLSREQLIEAVWDDGYQGVSNIVEVYVGRLRDKVDRPFGRRSLVTVRGVGYRIEEENGVANIA